MNGILNKQFPVGDIVEIKLKVVESTGCGNCFFYEHQCDGIRCSADDRVDGINISFEVIK